MNLIDHHSDVTMKVSQHSDVMMHSEYISTVIMNLPNHSDVTINLTHNSGFMMNLSHHCDVTMHLVYNSDVALNIRDHNVVIISQWCRNDLGISQWHHYVFRMSQWCHDELGISQWRHDAITPAPLPLYSKLESALPYYNGATAFRIMTLCVMTFSMAIKTAKLNCYPEFRNFAIRLSVVTPLYLLSLTWPYVF